MASYGLHQLRIDSSVSISNLHLPWPPMDSRGGKSMATRQPSWQKLFAKSWSDRKYLKEITLFFVDFSTLKYWTDKVSYWFCMGLSENMFSLDIQYAILSKCRKYFLSVDTMCYFVGKGLSENIFCLQIKDTILCMGLSENTCMWTEIFSVCRYTIFCLYAIVRKFSVFKNNIPFFLSKDF